eukprot:68687-Pleurochrysis_carterae.AAC.1
MHEYAVENEARALGIRSRWRTYLRNEWSQWGSRGVAWKRIRPIFTNACLANSQCLLIEIARTEPNFPPSGC